MSLIRREAYRDVYRASSVLLRLICVSRCSNIHTLCQCLPATTPSPIISSALQKFTTDPPLHNISPSCKLQQYVRINTYGITCSVHVTNIHLLPNSAVLKTFIICERTRITFTTRDRT